jgi:hypothetical protein
LNRGRSASMGSTLVRTRGCSSSSRSTTCATQQHSRSYVAHEVDNARIFFIVNWRLVSGQALHAAARAAAPDGTCSCSAAVAGSALPGPNQTHREVAAVPQPLRAAPAAVQRHALQVHAAAHPGLSCGGAAGGWGRKNCSQLARTAARDIGPPHISPWHLQDACRLRPHGLGSAARSKAASLLPSLLRAVPGGGMVGSTTELKRIGKRRWMAGTHPRAAATRPVPGC